MAQSLTCTLVVLGVLVYLRRRLGLDPLGPYHNPRELLSNDPAVVTFSVALYAGSISYSTGFLLARHTVLTHAGEAELGLLQATLSLPGTLMLVLNPTNGLFLTPILNRPIPQAEKLNAALEFQTKPLVVIGALAMPLVLFPEWILILLYSPAFATADPTLFIVVVAQCILLLAGVHQALLIGLNDLRAYAVLIALANLALGGLSWVLVPLYGPVGVGFALVGSATLLFSLTLARLRWRYQFRVSVRALGLVAFVVVAVALVSLLSREQVHSISSFLARLAVYAMFVTSLVVLAARREAAMLLASATGWLQYARKHDLATAVRPRHPIVGRASGQTHGDVRAPGSF